MNRNKEILVGIVVDSDLGLPAIKETVEILENFGIGYEMNIISAHRTQLYFPKRIKQIFWYF